MLNTSLACFCFFFYCFVESREMSIFPMCTDIDHQNAKACWKKSLRLKEEKKNDNIKEIPSTLKGYCLPAAAAAIAETFGRVAFQLYRFTPSANH